LNRELNEEDGAGIKDYKDLKDMLGSIKGSEVFINRTPRTQLYGPHWKAYKDAEAAAAAAAGAPPTTPPPATPPTGAPATSGAAAGGAASGAATQPAAGSGANGQGTLARFENGDEDDQQ